MVEEINLVVVADDSDEISSSEICVSENETSLLFTPLHLENSDCQGSELLRNESGFVAEMTRGVSQ